MKKLNLILFHSGAPLPTWLECTFKQIRLFNPNIDIHFITDKELLDDELFEKYNVLAYDKDPFYSKKIEKFENMYNWPKGFWVITTTRFMYIENFLKEHDLTDVYLFENDILLYYDLRKFHSTFLRLYKHMAITPGGHDRNMTGFMFIKRWQEVEAMTSFFISTIKKNGLPALRKKYNTDMVHEMSLMKMYEVEKGIEYLTYLPILPFGSHSANYEEFNSVFDPASWGQYVGGTAEGIPGAKPANLYISQVLIDNPDYDVIWKKDTNDLNIPYFKYNDNYDDHEIKINNLHIHSKNLDKYVSYD
jgi:hypothetical protein